MLRVSIHCEGCKKKVRKVLLHVDGVYRCDIDARMNKVTVTASRNIDAGILIARLRKSGKQAGPWPEEPKQPQPAESQSQENKAEDQPKPNEPAEKPAGAGTPPESAAAEPSDAQPTPEPEKKSADEAAPKPPAQESKEADETGQQQQQQPNEAARGKAKLQQPQQPADQIQDQKPIDAKVTLEFEGRSRGGVSHGGHHMPMMPQQQPVHVMSYNVARPMVSASYYAAAPVPAAPSPMPMPMARPGPPSQGSGYIDEYAPAPSYYSRPAPSAASYSYEPAPYYYPPQEPSPYYRQYNQRSAAEDYYYGSEPAPAPQRSAFSPPRDAYGDMFNDENANSCSVM